LGHSWVATQLAASQEGLSSMNLASYSWKKNVKNELDHTVRKSADKSSKQKNMQPRCKVPSVQGET
jgi:hypothetical protein